jgi:hypothetical protein
MSWVLRNSDARLGDRLVLLVLADHAKEDGSSAWPSVLTIAVEARMSTKQVQRCLANLKRDGRIVATGRSRSGTHIYRITMSEGDNMSGATNPTSVGDKMSPEPSLEQPSDTSSAPAARNGHRQKPTRAQTDEVWDTLTDIFGPALTRTAEQLRGKHVHSLAEAGATRDEILRRAKAWPAHFDTATMTAAALEKHWDTLGRKPLRGTTVGANRASETRKPQPEPTPQERAQATRVAKAGLEQLRRNL